MSTIKANDLQTTTGGIPTVKGQKLIPTAWVNFNGTGTVAIRDSENVSSITDGGTGRYAVNFSTTMANANYCVLGTTSYQHSVSGNIGFTVVSEGSAIPKVDKVEVISRRRDTNANTDVQYNYMTVLGGQA